MAGFMRKHSCSNVPVLRSLAKCGPIGINIGDNTVTVAQLASNGKGINLVAGGSVNQPRKVVPGSITWQRWVIDALRELTGNGRFRGREVIAAMPAGEVFVDHMRMPKLKDALGPDDKIQDHKLQDTLFTKIRQKLSLDPNDVMIRHLPAENDNVVVAAVERKIIDRHLAIYEKANLQVKSIGIWPVALINSYTKFFGRRQADTKTIVMLLQIDTDRTNVVISRHQNLLFARSVPIGADQIDNDEAVTRLVLELTACRRQFHSMYEGARIERVIFMARQSDSKNSLWAMIAKQLEMPAQVGDCLAAVKIGDPCRAGVDRRDCRVNWTTAFGLSLS
jgi:Tfp pilus assembly PilM family ATPase